jgi:hypothetical protein
MKKLIILIFVLIIVMNSCFAQVDLEYLQQTYSIQSRMEQDKKDSKAKVKVKEFAEWYSGRLEYIDQTRSGSVGNNLVSKFTNEYIKEFDLVTVGAGESGLEINLGQAAKYLMANKQAQADRKFQKDHEILLYDAGVKIANVCNNGKNCMDALKANLDRNPLVIETEQKAGVNGSLNIRLKDELLNKGIEAGLAGAKSKIDELGKHYLEESNKINGKVDKIIKDVAGVLHAQQEFSVALVNLNGIISQNHKEVMTGIGETKLAVQENIKITKAVLAATQEIGVDVKAIKGDVSAMREEQRIDKIQKYFEDSPIKDRIADLKKPESDISKLYANQPEKKAKLLKSLEVARVKEVTTKTMNLVNEWGNVGLEALNVFCKDCPPEVAEGVKIGMGVTNIAGNVLTGNYSQAIMGALGLFKKPQPSPEMQMLTQITKQLDALNSTMDEGFRKTHEQLFNIEGHLTQRFDIVDQKLGAIHENLLTMREEMLSQFSTVDAKLNFIMRQNSCLKDVIVKLGSDNTDVCKGSIEALSELIKNKPIIKLQDFQNKFDAAGCKDCIERLFINFNRKLITSPIFMYTDCPSPDANIKLLPDEMYKFLYNKVFFATKPSKLSMASLMFIPKDVVIAPVLRDSLKSFLKNPKFEIVEADKSYRNYRIVLAFTDYVLTLLPFIELYDHSKGSLLTSDELKSNPERSIDRMAFLKKAIENTLDLIDHTIMQQSLLSGNGIFNNIDGILSKNIQDSEDFDINDAFAANQYLNKNYATYFLNKNVGFNKLKSYSDRMKLTPSFTPPSTITATSKIEYTRDGKDKFGYRVFTKKNATEFNTIPVFTGILPSNNGTLEKNNYTTHLEFAVPSSIPELYAARQRLLDKLLELEIVSSKDLDNPNSEFTRKDLKDLLIAVKN